VTRTLALVLELHGASTCGKHPQWRSSSPDVGFGINFHDRQVNKLRPRKRLTWSSEYDWRPVVDKLKERPYVGIVRIHECSAPRRTGRRTFRGGWIGGSLTIFDWEKTGKLLCGAPFTVYNSNKVYTMVGNLKDRFGKALRETLAKLSKILKLNREVNE